MNAQYVDLDGEISAIRVRPVCPSTAPLHEELTTRCKAPLIQVVAPNLCRAELVHHDCLVVNDVWYISCPLIQTRVRVQPLSCGCYDPKALVLHPDPEQVSQPLTIGSCSVHTYCLRVSGRIHTCPLQRAHAVSASMHTLCWCAPFFLCASPWPAIRLHFSTLCPLAPPAATTPTPLTSTPPRRSCTGGCAPWRATSPPPSTRQWPAREGARPQGAGQQPLGGENPPVSGCTRSRRSWAVSEGVTARFASLKTFFGRFTGFSLVHGTMLAVTSWAAARSVTGVETSLCTLCWLVACCQDAYPWLIFSEQPP